MARERKAKKMAWINGVWRSENGSENWRRKKREMAAGGNEMAAMARAGENITALSISGAEMAWRRK